MSKSVRYLTHAAIIAALYVVLTHLSNAFGLASGAIQLRVSEALTILPLFTPVAIPGLAVGCLIANLTTGCVFWDIVGGTIATLLGALGTHYISRSKWTGPIWPILANTIIVPFVLRYGYGVEIPIPLMMVYIAVGEFIGCYVLGELLATAVLKRKVIPTRR